MRTILLFIVAFCVVAMTAEAREDCPLGWKLQRWEFIVLTQAGDETGTTETRHVQNNIIAVLRGEKEGLPDFEWWLHKDHVKGQYYLMCYHKAPPGTSAWQSFNVTKSESDFTILNFYTNDRTAFYDGNSEYKDMTLGRLKELLKEVSFEPDVEKTEYCRHGMTSPSSTLNDEVVAVLKFKYPNAILKEAEDQKSMRTFSRNMREFTIYRLNMTGDWQKPMQVMGPDRGGISVHFYIEKGKWEGQWAVPPYGMTSMSEDFHVFKETTLVGNARDGKSHIWIRILEPKVDAPKTVVTKLLTIFGKWEKYR